VSLLRLASGEDFLWRPLMAGLCHYESVVDGTLDLADIALMNELLDVQAENNRRLADHDRER
jgi:hypothetical protein